MKKIILILAVLICGIVAKPQVYQKVLSNYAFTSSDTTIVVAFTTNSTWQIQAVWSSLIMASGDAPEISIYTSVDGVNFNIYDTTYTYTLPDSSSSTIQFSDAYFAGKWLGIRITSGTISTGTLNITLIGKLN